jgi:chromosome segregation ATPase
VSLETQLEEQEQEANNVIAQWQETYSKTDERCAELNKELAAAKTEIKDLKNDQPNQSPDHEYSDGVILEWRGESG